MKINILLLSLAFMFSACASAGTAKPTDANQHIKVSKSAPPDSYTKIGPITATDGSNCRRRGGIKGTYDGALIKLKNTAATKGGDYVQVISATKPHPEGVCFNNAYTINGTLYKRIDKSPAPTPISAKKSNEKSGYEKLLELKNLLDKGIITKQEFEDQKKLILKKGL